MAYGWRMDGRVAGHFRWQLPCLSSLLSVIQFEVVIIDLYVLCQIQPDRILILV